MKQDVKGRRQLVAGLGAAATAVAVGARPSAQAPAHFMPTRHSQDEWMGKMTGSHRVILDVTTAEGMPDAIRFVGNLYTGHQSGYNVPESDLAVIVVLRHSATAYGYNNTLWAKHGAELASKAAIATGRQSVRLRRPGAAVDAGQARGAVHGVRHGEPRFVAPPRGRKG